MRSNEVDTEFAYDPLGRRLLKHSTPKLPVSASAQAAANPAWLASETARLSRERGYGVTLYGWDGDQIAWEGDAETTTHYVFEPGSFVPLLLAKAKQRIALIPTPDWSERDYDIDADPLWTYSPEPQPFEQLYFYHTDHLGTPQELTDTEGNLAWSADYKAWGEAKAVISEAAKRAGIDNPLRFQGQYFDHETGLHYNRHRYYDPSVGRFISKDPISLQGGLNIFAYAPNPVEWIDPLGLAKKFGTGKGKHTATVTVKDDANQIKHQCELQSGDMTPEEKALGFPLNSLATHTEARATKHIPLSENETMEIAGQYPPCKSCQGKMRKRAEQTGSSIIYTWPEDGATKSKIYKGKK